MLKLPGKIFLFSFALILFFIFVKFHPVLSANPQDIFYNTDINSLNQQESDADAKAKQDQAAQVFDIPVTTRDFAVTTKVIAGAVICVNPKKCEEKSTALGAVAYAIGSIFAHPPASGIYYAYDVLE